MTDSYRLWSWIAEADRGAILRCVQARLRPGGVLYLGYHALPGWASFLPVRPLLVEHAEAAGGQGAGIVDRVGKAMAFVARLPATGPAMARDNPGHAGMVAAFVRRDASCSIATGNRCSSAPLGDIEADLAGGHAIVGSMILRDDRARCPL